MSERPKSGVIERVRKILSKTEESGCTPAEAEAAFQMASRIMAEHNLDMADVEARGDQAAESFLDEFSGYATGKWSLEDNLAYGIVKEFFFIEAYFSHAYIGGKVKKRLMFFGKASNCEAAKFTFTALQDAFDRLFAEYRKRTGCAATERRLFVSGVANGFADKMRDERRAMEIERDITQGRGSGGTALALASVQEQTVAAYEKAHGQMKKAKANFASVRGSQSSLAAGYAAGRSLNLNRAVGGSGGRKAIEG